MNSIPLSQQSLITLKRYAILVLFICYIPHITTEPAWLLMMFLAAIGYRLLSDYFSYPPLPWWVRSVIFIGCLFLLGINIFTDEFFVLLLLIPIILKSLELHTTRDLKVIILCNFLLIFSALIVTQDLWIIIYMFIAILANLSIMIKLSAPQATLSQIGSKSGQQLLIVIPFSILLFYVFPRIDPLWHTRVQSKVSTALDEKMNPGSLAELFNDDSIVMRISFTYNPILHGYWREIILSFYTGETWYPSSSNYSIFIPLREFNENETADYEFLLEPNHEKWLFYDGYPVAGEPDLIFSPDHGLMRANKEAITGRFGYSLKVQSAPYHALSPAEYAIATQLPNNINPRLTAWAKEQFQNAHNDLKVFIAFLRTYIHEQSFWYTLTPPTLSNDNNQMDSFWFDTQKGFCEHYASAVTFILRAVGIPSRVIIGYQGGKWNPITRTITIQQNDAHAWLEYWQEGAGWQQLDPTSFIASARVDESILSEQNDLLDQGNYFIISDVPWPQKISLLVDSARFYSEEWFLFYNKNTQKNLLQYAGLGEWNTGQLLEVSVIFMPLFFFVIGCYYKWRQKELLDPLVTEYYLLQKEFRKFNISTHPSATLKQQCNSLINKVPALAPVLSPFIHRYEQLRLMPSKNSVKENKKETIALFKKVRYILRGKL